MQLLAQTQQAVLPPLPFTARTAATTATATAAATTTTTSTTTNTITAATAIATEDVMASLLTVAARNPAWPWFIASTLLSRYAIYVCVYIYVYIYKVIGVMRDAWYQYYKVHAMTPMQSLIWIHTIQLEPLYLLGSLTHPRFLEN